MAKKQTFADKIAKVKGAGMEHCPTCGDIMHPTKVTSLETVSGKMKTVMKMVKICKCNTAEVYG
jgi:hypothetical protein